LKVTDPQLDKETDKEERLILEASLKRERRIYIHKSKLDEYKLKPTPGYTEPREWVPNLACHYIGAMTATLENWMKWRSKFWFTSLIGESYRTGEESAAIALRRLTAGLAARTDKTITESKEIAMNMLAMFDFFPDEFEDRIKFDHAAACAGRHLAEYFQYNPLIQAQWRDQIVTDFINQWIERISTDLDELKQRGKKRDLDDNVKPVRKPDALEEMLRRSKTLSLLTRSYYDIFAKCITWQ
jgi:hypothetical protein